MYKMVSFAGHTRRRSVIRLRTGGPEPLRPKPAASARQDADPVLTGISLGEYQSLVRLAALLLDDALAAEDVVREALVTVHASRRRPRDAGKALSCLRREVVSRSRSVLRRRAAAARTVPPYAWDGPGAEPGTVTSPEHSELLAALRGLPCLQREAVVLRYYAALPEAEIAASMGISKGAVRHYTARGVAALKPVLERDVPLRRWRPGLAPPLAGPGYREG